MSKPLVIFTATFFIPTGMLYIHLRFCHGNASPINQCGNGEVEELNQTFQHQKTS